MIEWLLAGDPSIRWQVQRDLLDVPESDWRAERAKIAAQGWGAELLGHCGPADGLWDGGYYTPKWTSTHYTLQLLSLLGALPELRIEHGVEALLARGVLADGGVIYNRFGKLGETCETGMLLQIAASFGVVDERVERMVGYLEREQMTDGGWNCQRRRGATHSSFHTTICVLEGLAAYRAGGGARNDMVLALELRGRAFLAVHRLFRSHRTGEVVKEALTRFAFPYWWHYDVLRGLDYLQSAHAERDEGFGDGIELVRSRRRGNGTWTRQNRYAGKEWLEMERTGDSSRWNTLRALRVLRWWERVS